MSLGVNSLFSLGLSGSPGASVSVTDSRESLRGLNSRLAGYLEQVRALQEANGKLEAQIRERASSRGTEERDWSQYDKTITLLREQLRELSLDNGRLMMQIDNARLAADDFRIKFEAELGVRLCVDQDVLNLRKMTDDTNMSRLQLESEIEALREELTLLDRNHQEDVANLKGQIRGSSVDVHMETKKGEDLSETIDKIRQQYERGTQKSREETEAWYQAKFDSVSAEVSRSTESIQQSKNELNDLRRQRQILEIDLQAQRSTNHSLEDNLKDTAGRYAQAMNHHNATIQQLEAELGEVHAQVARQGAEYQALLNIKIKLEEEIATYQHLLEGTGLDNSIRDTSNRKGGTVRGTGTREDTNIRGTGTREDTNIRGTGTREDINVRGTGTREDTNIRGTGTREDTNVRGTGAREDINVRGTGAREDINVRGTGTREDTNIRGTGTREDTNIRGTGTREDSNIRGTGVHEDANAKDSGAREDSKVRDTGTREDTSSNGTGVAEDEIVEFSLEQALNAAPSVPTPDPTITTIWKLEELEVVSRRELNTANGAVQEKEEERGKSGEEEEAAALEEPPTSSIVEDVEEKVELIKVGPEVKGNQDETWQKVEEKQDGLGQKVEENQDGTGQKVEENQGGTGQKVEETQGGTGQKVKENQDGTGQKVEKNQDGTGQKVEENQGGTGQKVEENQDGTGQKVEENQGGTGQKVEENQGGTGQKVEEKQDGTGHEMEKKQDLVVQEKVVLQEPPSNEEEQKE